MNNLSTTGLAKWPFLVGDLLLLGMTAIILGAGEHPLEIRYLGLSVLCVLAGAALSILPFLMEYRAAVKLAETAKLTTAVEQIQNLELVSCQISSATAQWQSLQEQAAQSVQAAGEAADRIGAESRTAAEVVQKANSVERQRLQLEVDKLHQAEGEWLQVSTRLLDHIYALYQAGVRSTRGDLIEQLSLFQNACRDVIRRVGLVPFVPVPGETYDHRVHQLHEGEAEAPAHARIAETLATGYTYQGQLLRRALVGVQSSPAPAEGVAHESANPAAPAPAETVESSVAATAPSASNPTAGESFPVTATPGAAAPPENAAPAKESASEPTSADATTAGPAGTSSAVKSAPSSSAEDEEFMLFELERAEAAAKKRP
jgi:molecular chaperone GrpE (heat shock protein)